MVKRALSLTMCLYQALTLEGGVMRSLQDLLQERQKAGIAIHRALQGLGSLTVKDDDERAAMSVFARDDDERAAMSIFARDDDERAAVAVFARNDDERAAIAH